jgi:hypothetical protein
MARTLVLTAVTAIALAPEAHANFATALPAETRTAIGTPLAAEAPVGEDLWLGYNYSTGAAATGRLAADGTSVGLGTFGFDRNWSHIVPTTNGLVLFHNLGGIAVTGQFQADGSFQDLRTYRGSDYVQTADFAHNVVATSDGILLFYRVTSDRTGYKGLAWTGRIKANGDLVRLSETYLFDFWTNIVPANNGLVFFYNVYTGAAATGRIDANGGFRDLNSYSGFDPWTQIVATTDGTLLFYNGNTGLAATGRIDANGNYADLQNLNLGLGARIVPTTKGGILIFRSQVVLRAQFTAQGGLTGGQYVKGLSAPEPVVFVR